MKKLIALSIALVSLNAGVTHAENKAHSSCATVLCLGGILLGGKAETGCDSAISQYFDIKEYDDSGFSPALTSISRMNFLQQCPQGREQHDLINAKYGTLFSAPPL